MLAAMVQGDFTVGNFSGFAHPDRFLLWHWLHLKRCILSLRVSVQNCPPWYLSVTRTDFMGSDGRIDLFFIIKGAVAFL